MKKNISNNIEFKHDESTDKYYLVDYHNNVYAELNSQQAKILLNDDLLDINTVEWQDIEPEDNEKH